MRLWIDTDIGSDVDDALTLAYALRHPQLEVVGVSTVFGDIALRTRIARALLELAGAPEIPVIGGLGAPLTTGRDGRMFGHEGRGLLGDAEPVMMTEADDDADGRIDALGQALAKARPEAILAIGPMTNLGALARANSALPPITVMGGKLSDVDLPGTLPQIPEWNWWCDPDAVDLVLAAPASEPPRVVPIEVTFQTVLPQEDWSQLETGDDLARALGALCEEWITAQRERFGSKNPRVHLHDPLAAMTLVDDAVSRFEPRHIRIDAAGVTHHVAKDAEGVEGAEVEVAVSVDRPRLSRQLMHTWMQTVPAAASDDGE